MLVVKISEAKFDDLIKDVVRSSVKVPEFDKHLKKAGGHIGRNVVEITMKMKTIIRKSLKKKKVCVYLLSLEVSFYIHQVP